MKLTQFVHLINGFNPIDFQKSRTISMGKVAILSWKFAIFVSVRKSTFLVWILWNLHSLSILSIASTLLIFKKYRLSVWKGSHFKLKICCLSDKVYISSLILVKLTQFVHQWLQPIWFWKKKWKISMGKLLILSWKICISCLLDRICIVGQIFMKFTQFFYIINSLNGMEFKQNLTISKEK